MLIYAPRNKAEVGVFHAILAAAWDFCVVAKGEAKLSNSAGSGAAHAADAARK